MGYSFSEDTGDGTKVTFAFAFIGPDNGYFNDEDIKVEVDAVDTAFTLTGPTQVTLATAPIAGAKVRILRKPPTDAPYTDFERGNSFGKLNINRSFQQQLYLTHRAMDGFKEDGYYEKQNKSMGNYQIKDLGDGSDYQDACTIKQVVDVLGDNEQAKTDAEAAATEAAESAAAAQISKDQSAWYANAAGISETNASTSETNAEASAAAANESKNSAATSAETASASEGVAVIAANAASVSKQNAETAANNASTSETNAGTSETNALNSANTSIDAAASAVAAKELTEGYKDEALISKNNAETAATNAGTSETNAGTSANLAEAYMDAALISKNEANNSAAAAATSRDTTEGYRDEALISKNSAETAATNASTSESNASTSATEAAASAAAALISENNASDSAIASAASAVYSEEFIEHSESPMLISGGELSRGTDALTLKVSALEAYLRASNSESGHLTKVSLAEQDNIAIPVTNTVYFVSLNYNDGTPGISLSTTHPYNADKRNIPIGRVTKDTTENVVHFLGAGYRLNDGMEKTQKALYIKDGLTLSKGANIAYSGTNNFTMTEGISFAGINEFILPAFNSAVTTFKTVYRDGSGGYTVGAARNTIDYAHYDDGSGVLATVPNNRYSCFWVYKHIDDGSVYVMYGYAKGSLIEAETSPEPTRPDHITAFGLLIGKIITPYNGGSFTEVFMATDTQFAGHLVSDHNQLSSLQGGALNEYYHTTAAEHAVIQATSGINTGDETKASVETLGIDYNSLSSKPFLGSASTRNAQDILAPGSSLPDADAVLDHLENNIKNAAVLRIAIIGDSLSDGLLSKDSWVNIFREKLSQHGICIDIQNWAIGGATFYTALNSNVHAGNTKTQVQMAIAGKPDLVIVALGANDYMFAPTRTASQVTQDGEDLFDAVHAGLPNAKIALAETIAHDITATGGKIPTALTNAQTVPFFHKLITYNTLPNCRINTATFTGTSIESADLALHSAWGTGMAALESVYDYHFNIDLWKIVRMGLTVDNVHPNNFGHYWIAMEVLEGFKSIYSYANITINRDITTLSEYYTDAIAGNTISHAYATYCGICIQDSIEGWFYKERTLSAYVGPEYIMSDGYYSINITGADPGTSFWYAIDSADGVNTGYVIRENGKIMIPIKAANLGMTSGGAHIAVFGMKLSDDTYDLIYSTTYVTVA